MTCLIVGSQKYYVIQATMQSYCCAIDKLKTKSEQTLTFSEMDKIIKAGPPKPTLNIVTTITKCQRHFHGKLYEQASWMCGCSTQNKLFCWPCLLFSNEKNTWNYYGYSDLNNIYKAMKKHRYTCAHISCEKQLKMFGKFEKIEFSLSNEYKLSVEQHNSEVRKNREILSHFIRAVCFLGRQGLAFRGHDEREESSNRGNFIEYVSEILIYDKILKDYVENSTAFCATSTEVQNDLISSVSTVITRKIKNEISNACFVSLMLDETHDVSSKGQMSTVFRYVTANGDIKERFISFKDVSSDRKADSLLQHVLDTINDFSCSDKLIAQTYDGAAVLAGLQSKLREHCKYAMFVHCYAHQLNLVLLQSTCCIKEIKLFFNALTGFGVFFSKSTKRVHALDEEVKERIPSVSLSSWNFQSLLIRSIKEYKIDLEHLFESMVNNENSDWDEETVMCAGGLLASLKDFMFNFLLTIYDKIFQYSDILFQELQNNISNIAYCNKMLENFNVYLHKYRDRFDELWTAMTESGIEMQPMKRIRLDTTEESHRSAYRQLYVEIVDTVKQSVLQRYSEITSLRFVSLLDHTLFSDFQLQFPEGALKSLIQNYESFFNFTGLKSELCVIYKDPDMKKNSIGELHQYIRTMDLSTVFPETFKLATLIMTLPATSSSVEMSFSYSRRIKNYLHYTQQQERLSALALMSIENKLLQDLRSQPTFEDDVIEVFAEKNQRIQLIYKPVQ